MTDLATWASHAAYFLRTKCLLVKVNCFRGITKYKMWGHRVKAFWDWTCCACHWYSSGKNYGIVLQRAILLLDDRYAQNGNAVETHVRPELQLCLNKTFPDGCDPEILRKQKENVSAKSTDEEPTISVEVAT